MATIDSQGSDCPENVPIKVFQLMESAPVVSVNRLKVPQRPDDISRVNPIEEESPEVQRLRTVHRCGMCHKRCLIPCKFTGDEFRQLVAGLAPSGEAPSSSA